MPMHLPRASPEAVRLFGELIPDSEKVSRRMVFGQPAAFARGNMFFGVFGEKLFVRLSESDRAEALRTPGFATFEPMPGRTMAEYVVLPPAVMQNRTLCRRWVARSLGYVGDLPEKLTRRTK